jgi:hypothetical protein
VVSKEKILVKSQTSSDSSCQTLNDDKIELKMLNSFSY